MRTSAARRVAILAALLVAACGDAPSDGGDTPSDGGHEVLVITPADVVLDFGTVFIGEESGQSFTINAKGRASVPLGLARGAMLPADFTLAAAEQEVSAGSPATFEMLFAPLDPPGERSFDFEIRAPGGSPSFVKVHVRAVAQIRAIRTDPDPCLDFGTVMLGLEKTKPMEITNLADALLPIEVSVLDSAFSVDTAHLDLGPRDTSQVNVRFFPSARGAYDADLLFKLCDGCALLKRCLKGVAAIEAMTLAPNPLNFGTHLPGTTTCRDISVRNTGDVSIYVRDIRLDDGLVRAPDTFELRLGDILDNKEIRPTREEKFQLCFTPDELGAEYSGNVAVTTDNQVQRVAVNGRSGGARIEAIPDHLELGMITAGEAITRPVVLTNVGEPTSVEVTQVEWTPDDGSLDVEHLELPYDVGLDDLVLDVTFSGAVPGDHAGSIIVTIGNGAGSEDTLVIPITAEVI